MKNLKIGRFNSRPFSFPVYLPSSPAHFILKTSNFIAICLMAGLMTGLMTGCAAPWATNNREGTETASDSADNPASSDNPSNPEGKPEGNRGNITIKIGGEVVYTAALNDSGNPVNDTDRQECAAVYNYGNFVLIGDHNYQGFDVLEKVGKGDLLVITPPSPNARNLALPPSGETSSDTHESSGSSESSGSPGSSGSSGESRPAESATPNQDQQGSSKGIISPFSGKTVEVGEDPKPVTDSEEGLEIESEEGSEGLTGQSASADDPVEYHFLERRKGVREYGSLTDEEGNTVKEIAASTGAQYVTYTCRGNSDTDVWIVLWIRKTKNKNTSQYFERPKIMCRYLTIMPL